MKWDHRATHAKAYLFFKTLLRHGHLGGLLDLTILKCLHNTVCFTFIKAPLQIKSG